MIDLCQPDKRQELLLQVTDVGRKAGRRGRIETVGEPKEQLSVLSHLMPGTLQTDSYMVRRGVLCREVCSLLRASPVLPW